VPFPRKGPPDLAASIPTDGERRKCGDEATRKITQGAGWAAVG
jgi:hypothetical protein